MNSFNLRFENFVIEPDFLLDLFIHVEEARVKAVEEHLDVVVLDSQKPNF